MSVAGVKKVGKLVICGVGLIGGSFALALRQAGLVEHVVGIGRRPEPLAAARELGIIDEAATDWAAALAGAELVLLAMPVGQMDAVAAAIAPHLGPDTIVTDAGSTKRDVIEAIYRSIREKKPQAARSAAETHIDFVRETLAQTLRSVARRETAERRLNTEFTTS